MPDNRLQTDPEDAEEEFEFAMTIDAEEADEFNLADHHQFAVALQDEGEYLIEHLVLDGWEIDSIDREGWLDVEEDDTGLSFVVDAELVGQSLRCIFALTSTDGAADDEATDDGDDEGEAGGTIESLPSTAGSQTSPGTAARSRSQDAASSQPLPSTAATPAARSSSQHQPSTSAAEAPQPSSSPIRAPSTVDTGLR
jgi:hypothetical protein